MSIRKGLEIDGCMADRWRSKERNAPKEVYSAERILAMNAVLVV